MDIRRKRREAARKKEGDTEAFLAQMASKPSKPAVDDAGTNNQVIPDSRFEPVSEEQQEQFDKERRELVEEASLMTKSLLRMCLRSTRILRPGNEHDEADFQKREEEYEEAVRKSFRVKPDDDGFFPLPPQKVDRENELRSRYDYYHAHTLERFEGDRQCLQKDPWHEGDPERYAELLKKGEERRKWVLQDYKFEDSYPDHFDTPRVDAWLKRASKFVGEHHLANNWNHSVTNPVPDVIDDSEEWDEEEEEPEFPHSKLPPRF